MIDDFEITESTTREELIVHVNDLEEEIQRLLERLTEAADEEAARGHIHNTPHAKLQWIKGN